jgi:hypothetical protein
MARKGPITKDTSTVALGLAQIRVGASAMNIGSIHPVLLAADSIGALANTKFASTVDYWRLESGFPLMEDMSIPLREAASLECAVKEITPFNLAMAKGIDPTSGYTAAHSGEVKLGAMTTPAFIRMEAIYTYPNGTNYLNIIFPRCQVVSSIELDFQAEDAVASPLTFEAKQAHSEIVGGSAVWDDKPLGRLEWT